MTGKGLDPEDMAIRLQLNRSFLRAPHRMHVAGTSRTLGMSWSHYGVANQTGTRFCKIGY
jgi:hypothetical protein